MKKVLVILGFVAVLLGSIIFVRSFFNQISHPLTIENAGLPTDQSTPVVKTNEANANLSDAPRDDSASSTESVPVGLSAPEGEEKYWALLAPALSEELLDMDRISPDLVWPNVPMRMEAVVWKAYQMALTNSAINVGSAGYDMLNSSSEMVRAMGAIWMVEKLGTLDVSILDRLVLDESPFVPLAVLGWMKDAGNDHGVRQMVNRWQNHPAAWQSALDILNQDSLGGIAGRAALWLVDQSSLQPENKRNIITNVAEDRSSSYDQRWEATMMLSGYVEWSDYQQFIGSLAGFTRQQNAGDQEKPGKTKLTNFDMAMILLSERMTAPEENQRGVWTLTPDDADLFFAQESAFMLENVALWVEAAVDRHLVAVQAGFSNKLSEYLLQVEVQDLPANQVLTVRRIQARLNKLRQMEQIL